MTVSATDIANALLVSTRDGGYPESEEVLKTDLGASALQSSLQLVNEAKHRIEVSCLLRLLANVHLTKVCCRQRFKILTMGACLTSTNG
jgi:hypothetical protein